MMENRFYHEKQRESLYIYKVEIQPTDVYAMEWMTFSATKSSHKNVNKKLAL